ncbi:MAG: helicase-related protein, partial [Candidatus Hodarchaeales archaeon]|jgi:superfamily II DNA or RNA helicase
VRKKILSKGKVTLFSVAKSERLKDCYKYWELYEKAIVKNRKRNIRIIKAAKLRNERGLSVLIIVKEIKHGNYLVNIADIFSFDILFLQGSTHASICVITTDIWREGIDIPTLDVVINACGGKAETKTLQAIGRGLRTAQNKPFMEIIDFLDPYRHLAEHTIERLSIYKKEELL